MVRPMAEKSVWIFITLFPVFVSITQFSDFWVMSYGNWKHILCEDKTLKSSLVAGAWKNSSILGKLGLEGLFDVHVLQLIH